MGEVSESLIAKLNAAGLTDAEKIVLALATGAASDDDDVQGFGQIGRLQDLESQDKMGNFEIQRLMSTFNQAESTASSIFGGPIIGTFRK